MSKEKVNVSVRSEGGEVTIRQGDALPVKEPIKININGVLAGPAEFWRKKGKLYNPDKSHVTFSKHGNLWIKLMADEENPYGPEVKGNLFINPELTEFGINVEKRYTTTTLLSLLKMRKFLFHSTEAANKIIAEIQKFTLKANTIIEQESNNQGSSRNLTEIKVESSIPLKFTLEMPVFKGGKNMKFEVEVCFEVRDKGISLWLESMELKQLENDLVEELFTQELKEFSELVCIEC